MNDNQNICINRERERERELRNHGNLLNKAIPKRHEIYVIAFFLKITKNLCIVRRKDISSYIYFL